MKSHRDHTMFITVSNVQELNCGSTSLPNKIFPFCHLFLLLNSDVFQNLNVSELDFLELFDVFMYVKRYRDS